LNKNFNWSTFAFLPGLGGEKWFKNTGGTRAKEHSYDYEALLDRNGGV